MTSEWIMRGYTSSNVVNLTLSGDIESHTTLADIFIFVILLVEINDLMRKFQHVFDSLTLGMSRRPELKIFDPVV